MNATEAPNLENFVFLTEMLLTPLSRLPAPLKAKIERELRELLHLIENTRPPRFMLVGRRGSGKSTLINALFDAKVAKVGAVKAQTAKAEWREYKRDDATIEILDTRGFQEGDNPEKKIVHQLHKKVSKKQFVNIVQMQSFFFAKPRK